VSTAQDSITPPRLRFELEQGRVWCGAHAVELPPALLAWYAWLAECRLAGAGDQGFVRHSDATPERYLAIYQGLVGRHHPLLEQAKRSFAQGFEPSQFQERQTKINRLLDKRLSLAAGPYKLSRRGQRPHTRYGIDLAQEGITFAP
jgi:hypothetical protein